MIKKLTRLYKEDINYIIHGAAFLGSGGGGGISDAQIIAENIFSNCSYVQIKTIDEVGDQEKGAVVALMGAPSALKGLKDFTAPTRAFKLLEQNKGTEFTYSIPIEVGAVNSLVPMLVATQLGIAVIDADGAGRAVPQLEATTLAMANISPYPATIVNSINEQFPSYEISISLDKVKLPEGKAQADLMEETARNIINLGDFGQIGALSMYYIPQPKLQEGLIVNSLQYAYNIGKAIVEGQSKGNSIASLKTWLDRNEIGYFVFGEAKVISVEPTTENKGGFNVGIVKVKDEDNNVLTICYENENLFAYINDDTTDVWAMAPDLICYMTNEGALTNVEIAQGQTITIFGLPCSNKMRSEFIIDRFMKIISSLELYNGLYMPIEIIHESKLALI